MLTAAGENFGLAAGVLGVATAIPLIYGWFSRRLPSARMHVLERLLLETEGLFRSALEDGLLGDHHSLEGLHSRIWAVKGRIECLRVEVRRTNDDLKGWWNGLSGRASLLCDELKNISAEVAERSSRERERRGSDARRENFALLTYQREQISHIVSSKPPGCPLVAPLFGSCVQNGTGQRTPMAFAHILSGHARSDVPSIPTRQGRLKGEADMRRELLLRVGKKLFSSNHFGDGSTGHTATRRHRAGHIRELIRFIRRGFVRRSRQTTGVQDSIDVDPALFAAMQAADDKDTEWEDVEYLGKVQL
ncbi:hypothetical protein C8Q74DRAFT_1235115, partial [Fomes fomentarius]